MTREETKRMREGHVIARLESVKKLSHAVEVFKEMIGDDWTPFMKSRKESMVNRRYAMLHVLKTYSGASYEEMQRQLGIDHSTIVYALDSIPMRRRFVEEFPTILEDTTNRFYEIIKEDSHE